MSEDASELKCFRNEDRTGMTLAKVGTGIWLLSSNSIVNLIYYDNYLKTVKIGWPVARLSIKD